MEETPNYITNQTTATCINDSAQSAETTSYINIRVIHGKDVIPLKITSDISIRSLKDQLYNITRVPVDSQKLMHKGKSCVCNSISISSFGINSSSKLILIGTPLEETVKALVQPILNSVDQVREKDSDNSKLEFLSESREHARILSLGPPDNVIDGLVGIDSDLPLLGSSASIHGLYNRGRDKVRLTFRVDSGDLWFSTSKRTDKVPFAAVQEVISQPIKDRPEYCIVGFKLGKTDRSLYWVYWMPSQFVLAIRRTLRDNANTHFVIILSMTAVFGFKEIILSRDAQTLVVITGASRGFGRSCAIEMARSISSSKVHFVLVGRDSIGMAETASAIQYLCFNHTVAIIKYDLSDCVKLPTLFKHLINEINFFRLGSCNPNLSTAILINNSGSLCLGTVDTLPISGVINAISLNISSFMLLTSWFTRTLVCDYRFVNRIRVINVSSVLAHVASSYWGVYSSCKCARDMFLLTLAKEWENKKEINLKTLNYAPGPLETLMMEEVRSFAANAVEFQKMSTEGNLVKSDDSASKLISILVNDTYESGSHVDYFDLSITN